MSRFSSNSVAMAPNTWSDQIDNLNPNPDHPLICYLVLVQSFVTMTSFMQSLRLWLETANWSIIYFFSFWCNYSWQWP